MTDAQTGKSSLIGKLIIDDITQGIGVCVIDAHGEFIDHVLARLPGNAEEESEESLTQPVRKVVSSRKSKTASSRRGRPKKPTKTQ